MDKVIKIFKVIEYGKTYRIEDMEVSKLMKLHRKNKIKTYYLLFKDIIKIYWVCCQRCSVRANQWIWGYSRATQVHHLDKNRKNNRLSNLMMLCRKCHTSGIHGKMQEILLN